MKPDEQIEITDRGRENQSRVDRVLRELSKEARRNPAFGGSMDEEDISAQIHRAKQVRPNR